MMKKRAFPILIAIILLLTLTACGNSPSVSRENQIPEDGKVSAETFQTLKESGDLAMFSGEEGGIAYRWTFIGTDIGQPEDADLRMHFDTALDQTLLETLNARQAIAFSFEEPRQKPGNPTVEIVAGAGWESGQAAVCILGEDGQPQLVCEAVLGDQMAAFSLNGYEGAFYLVLKDEAQATATPEPTVTPEPTELPAESTPQPEAPKEEQPAATQAPTDSEEQPSAHTAKQQPPAAATEPPKAEPTEAPQPTVSLSIRCDKALQNYDKLDSSVRDERIVPSSGQILFVTDIPFSEGESVFDVLQRTCKEHKVHLESTYTPIRQSAYIEGINNLYEFSCGPLSGWMYSVNGWYPNYGCSSYTLKDGDAIEWNYTCDLGRDLGQYGVVQQTRD